MGFSVGTGIKFCVTTPTSTAVKQTLTYRFMGKYSDSGHFLCDRQGCRSAPPLRSSSCRRGENRSRRAIPRSLRLRICALRQNYLPSCDPCLGIGARRIWQSALLRGLCPLLTTRSHAKHPSDCPNRSNKCWPRPGIQFEEGGPTFSRPKGDGPAPSLAVRSRADGLEMSSQRLHRTRNALSRKQEKSAMHRE